MRDTTGPAPTTTPAERRAHQAGLDTAMRVLSYLIAGVTLYGLLGWGADRVLGTAFLLPVGILVGAGLGCYLVFRYIATLDAARTGDHTQVAETEGVR